MTQVDAYDQVTRQLADVTGHQPPGKGDWLCPAHGDRHPSLSVTRGANNNVILHCHAGCTVDQVLAAIHLDRKDLFDKTETNGATNGTRTPDTIYPYVDEAGRLLFEVVRYPNKEFRQRKPDGHGGYDWKLATTRRVPFHLPQLIHGISESHPVFICEGEKDVLAVERAGGIATCNPGGAGKWKPEYNQHLRDADVIIVADNDLPGEKHALDIELGLIGIAKRVRTVKAHEGKDAFDHLNTGHTLDDWLHQPTGRELQRELLGDLIAGGVPDPTMVHPWLYAGGLHSLQSEPGVGKSWVAIWMAKELIEAGWSVIYMDEEGGRNLVAGRLAALGADPALVDQRLLYYPFPQRTWDDADIQALHDVITSAPTPVAMGVFDSLPDFLEAAGLSEDSSMDVTGFIRKVLAPFRENGAALLVLDHLVKPSGETKRTRTKYARGSGAKLAKAHLTMLLETGEEFDRRKTGWLKLWATKDREGFTGLPRIHTDPLRLDVTVTAGHVAISIAKAAVPVYQRWNGPSECMDAALSILRPGGEYSQRAMQTAMSEAGHKYRPVTVNEALGQLAKNGVLAAREGPRNSKLYRWIPPEDQSDFDLDEEF